MTSRIETFNRPSHGTPRSSTRVHCEIAYSRSPAASRASTGVPAGVAPDDAPIARLAARGIASRRVEYAGREDRHAAVRQYSLAQILAVWAAAAIPMGLLAWVAAPLLEDVLGGDEPLAQALLICLTAGLIWQFVLVLILIRRELGGLEWPRVRDALWLRPPRDPKSGRVGGRVIIIVLTLVLD
jgi:hypothetical protein